MNGLVILIVIAAAFGCAFHTAFRNFALATFLSACLSTLVVLSWAIATDGYVDKLIAVACVVCIGVATIVNVVVGIPFALLRRKRRF